MNKKKLRFAIGGLIIVFAITYMVFAGARSNMVYYMTVEELMGKGKSFHGEGIRVSGKVVPASIVKGPQPIEVRFSVKDENGTYALPVYYSGIIPDMFKDEAPVIVEGRLNSDGVFHAKTLMTSCPSKYVPEDQQQQNVAQEKLKSY
jgi:cytochrome c-type biogenesis protein CcmE